MPDCGLVDIRDSLGITNVDQIELKIQLCHFSPQTEILYNVPPKIITWQIVYILLLSRNLLAYTIFHMCISGTKNNNKTNLDVHFCTYLRCIRVPKGGWDP